MVKFYQLDMSAPCRMVELTLAALGNVEYEKVTVNIMEGESKTPEYLKINPRGQIPTIVDGDFVVTQSVAIVRYLCNAYGATSNNKKLYPNDLRVRTRVDEICFLANDLRSNLVSYADIRSVLFHGAKGPNDEFLEKTKTALGYFEEILSRQDYVAASHLTFADFVAVTAVEMVHIANYKDWANYPNILKWEKRLAELPYYQEAYKRGFDKVNGFYQSKLKENREAKS